MLLPQSPCAGGRAMFEAAEIGATVAKADYEDQLPEFEPS